MTTTRDCYGLVTPESQYTIKLPVSLACYAYAIGKYASSILFVSIPSRLCTNMKEQFWLDHSDHEHANPLERNRPLRPQAQNRMLDVSPVSQTIALIGRSEPL